jgi:hypothetical protein
MISSDSRFNVSNESQAVLAVFTAKTQITIRAYNRKPLHIAINTALSFGSCSKLTKAIDNKLAVIKPPSIAAMVRDFIAVGDLFMQASIGRAPLIYSELLSVANVTNVTLLLP